MCWLVFSWPEFNELPERSGAVVGVPVDSPPAGGDSRCAGTKKKTLRFCCLDPRWLPFPSSFLSCFERRLRKFPSTAGFFLQRQLQFERRRRLCPAEKGRKKKLYENTFQEQKMSFIIRSDSRSERVSLREIKVGETVTKISQAVQAKRANKTLL